LHKAGLTPAQFATVMALDAKRLELTDQAQAMAEEAEFKAADEALHVKWGAAYKQNLHTAKRLLAEGTTEENHEAVRLAVGNNPVLVEFMATIGQKILEHKPMTDPDAVDSTAMTPAQADSRMKELIAERSQDSDLKYNNPEKYKLLNKEIDDLTKMSLAGQS